jgi:NodT family efflux transporter outer membrane factor (OMF) lipoprotein
MKQNFQKRTIPIAISVFVCSGLISCAVGPDFKRPEAPKAAAFTREQSVDQLHQDQAIQADWWKAYGSEELNALVDLALRNNPNIDAATANLKVAQQNVIAQQGFFLPQIGAGYGVTRQSTGNNLAPAINNVTSPTIYTFQTAQLSVGFVPDIFGGNRRAVESLVGQANSSQYQLDALRITLITNVIATAAQEAVYREEIEAARASVEAQRLQLEHMNHMVRLGYMSGMDLANAQSAYAAAAAQIPALSKMREQALDLLAIYCGKLPSEKLLLPSLESLKIPEHLPKALPSSLVEQRPDVRAAEELVRASNAQIGVAIANRIPQFSITGILGGVAGPGFTNLFGTDSIWSAGVGVTQPIFAGGTLAARQRAAEAGLDASVAQYKAVVLAAFQNVADTLYAIENDGKLYEFAKDGEAANKTVFEMTKDQFTLGYASEPGLLQAKQQYLQSKINRVQAFAVYLGDTAALYQSLGGGWVSPEKAAAIQERKEIPSQANQSPLQKVLN